MTRGIRNNNPLNIRHSADQWQGARAQQTDPSFVQFESMAYGYRAAWKVLETYWNHFTGHGLAFNVRTIIGRWAPPKENDTENYIRTVLLISGLGGMENLPQPSRKVDEERLVRLIGAMTCVECGIRYKEVDWNAIREGYELAFPGKRSYARTKPVPQESAINLTPDEIEDLQMWDEYRYW
ncbi:MAG: structural protein P5 [Bacteroidaceae bacterium]|nr:structural protein P5 [Bacteroidaceae bacterium]